MVDRQAPCGTEGSRQANPDDHRVSSFEMIRVRFTST